jgi:hypothetical protein
LTDRIEGKPICSDFSVFYAMLPRVTQKSGKSEQIGFSAVDHVKSDRLPGPLSQSELNKRLILLGPVNTCQMRREPVLFNGRILPRKYYLGRILGTTSVMYSIYFSEERCRSGQNGTSPCGLSTKCDGQLTLCCVARHSFGLAKPHSSRLAWNHLGKQGSELASVNRP